MSQDLLDMSLDIKNLFPSAELQERDSRRGNHSRIGQPKVVTQLREFVQDVRRVYQSAQAQFRVDPSVDNPKRAS